MKEIMIPNFKYRDECWIYKKINSFNELNFFLKYYDGSIKNIFLDISKNDITEKKINKLFENYKWLSKIIIKRGESLKGIYQRQKVQ